MKTVLHFDNRNIELELIRDEIEVLRNNYGLKKTLGKKLKALKAAPEKTVKGKLTVRLDRENAEIFAAFLTRCLYEEFDFEVQRGDKMLEVKQAVIKSYDIFGSRTEPLYCAFAIESNESYEVENGGFDFWTDCAFYAPLFCSKNFKLSFNQFFTLELNESIEKSASSTFATSREWNASFDCEWLVLVSERQITSKSGMTLANRKYLVSGGVSFCIRNLEGKESEVTL